MPNNQILAFGALLLFALLAIVMFLTRKVDWFSVAKPGEGNV
ncbi:MAG: inner membrane CreD family protein [Candidatus Pacebacteria bacterium]|nr:inner membrane CreD family protein [Candidatus Paceibacterota bacterium]